MLLLIEQTEVTEEVKENLNTSNVTVNLILLSLAWQNFIYLNTSNVTVNLI